MLLKLPGDEKLIVQYKKDVPEQIAILHNEKRFRSVVIVPEVDVV
jgi:primosomal protein N' (replication factor Y) (superfamily II helicase)